MGPQPGYDEGVGRRGGRTQPSNARPQADRSCHTRHIAVTCHMSFSKRLQHRRAVGGRQQRQGSSESLRQRRRQQSDGDAGSAQHAWSVGGTRLQPAFISSRSLRLRPSWISPKPQINIPARVFCMS